MIKKIGYKLLLLLVTLTAINVVYQYTFYKYDLFQKSDKVLDIEKINTEASDIIYFSDCSNTNFVEQDSTKKSISQLLNLFYPQLKINSVDMAASHAGIFKYWLNYLKIPTDKPSSIIVTLNLRSFNSSWINSDLENSLQESLVLMKPYPKIVNRFLLGLKAFEIVPNDERQKQIQLDWENDTLLFPYKTPYKTIKNWDSIMGNGTYLLKDGSWDMEKISLACHYVKSYAFNIQPNNPRLADFDEIVNWANDNHVKLYLNLIPENTQQATSLVNKDLLFLMRVNAAILENRYNRSNCVVLNNLELLSSDEFTDKTWTTEHYSYKGRMQIAKSVALSLRNDLKTKFTHYY